MENKTENPVFIIMMGRVKNEALLGGLHMSKPVSSRIEEEAMLLTVIYYCICAFLCCVADSTHLCVICGHFCSPLSQCFKAILIIRFYPILLIGPQERGSRKKNKVYCLVQKL